MYTNQSAFDKVVLHLRKQGHRAVDNSGSCLYRAPNGDQCAIGCLIPDEEYVPSLEGRLGSGNEIAELPSLRMLRAQFLLDLQQVHDEWYPKSNRDGNREYRLSDLELGFRDFADKYHLTIPQ